MTEPTPGGVVPDPQQPGSQSGIPQQPQPGANPFAQPGPGAVPRYGEVAPDRPPAYPSQTPPPFPQQPAPVGPAKAPSTVVYAFVLWIVGCVLRLITTLLLLFGDYVRQVMDQALLTDQGISDTEINSIISMSRSVGIGTGVVMVLVGILFGYFMYRGRNWARIVVTIFAAIGALSALSGMTMVGTTSNAGLAMIANLLMLAVLVVTIVLMFLRPSNQYFALRSKKGVVY